MKILYFKGKHPNFGDELNPWLWSKLLSGSFFDDDESTIFLGIGSIIGQWKLPQTTKKIIFGAGFVPGYSDRKPDISGDDYDIFFVRGPRTARMLNLPLNKSLGDSAILLRTLYKDQHNPQNVVFMPHWESLDRGKWEKACTLAGIQLVDPRQPVDDVLRAILNARVVIAEAMHGAIVADALRVPWIPVLPFNRLNREKWLDWAEALEMDLSQYRLFPSQLIETRLSFLRKPITSSRIAGTLENLLPHLAASRLKSLARVEPCLSHDSVIERVTDKMLEHVHNLKLKYGS